MRGEVVDACGNENRNFCGCHFSPHKQSFFYCCVCFFFFFFCYGLHFDEVDVIGN